MLRQKITEFHGRVDSISLYDCEPTKDEGQEIRTFTDDAQYLFELFPDFNGFKTKKEAAEKSKTIWYNFSPYDKKDPMLLTLM